MAIPLKIAIAGGGYGLEVFAPWALENPAVELAAFYRPWARDGDSRPSTLPERLQAISTLTKADQLAESGVRGVMLAAPPLVMDSVARELMTRDMALFIEKPVTPYLATAKALAAYGETHACWPGYQYDHHPAIAAFLRAARQQPIDRLDVRWHVQSRDQRAGVANWKADRHAFGGVLTAIGCHALFLAEALCGPLVLDDIKAEAGDNRLLTDKPDHAAADRLYINAHSARVKSIRFDLSNRASNTIHHRWVADFNGSQLVLDNPNANYFGPFSLTRDGRSILPPGGTETANPATTLMDQWTAHMAANTADPTRMRAAAQVVAHLEKLYAAPF